MTSLGTIHFKFASSVNSSALNFPGVHITLGDLKRAIVDRANLSDGSDFDLQITNAQTSEEYLDDGLLIPKNTSVIVRRVPTTGAGRIIQPGASASAAAAAAAAASFAAAPLPYAPPKAGAAGEDFGGDLYGANLDDEMARLAEFVDSSAVDWSRQTRGRGAGGRGARGRGGFRGGAPQGVPPPGYVCYRCGQSGHWISGCPTTGDPDAEAKRVKAPTGIPMSRLQASTEGTLLLPSGVAAVMRPSETTFAREMRSGAGAPPRPVPEGLSCPVCSRLYDDAVLIPCCGHTYCDGCVRPLLLDGRGCPQCGSTSIIADQLLPNQLVRAAADAHKRGVALAPTTVATAQRAQPTAGGQQVDVGAAVAAGDGGVMGVGVTGDPHPPAEVKREPGTAEHESVDQTLYGILGGEDDHLPATGGDHGGDAPGVHGGPPEGGVAAAVEIGCDGDTDGIALASAPIAPPPPPPPADTRVQPYRKPPHNACYSCGQVGHMARECPANNRGGGGGGGGGGPGGGMGFPGGAMRRLDGSLTYPDPLFRPGMMGLPPGMGGLGGGLPFGAPFMGPGGFPLFPGLLPQMMMGLPGFVPPFGFPPSFGGPGFTAPGLDKGPNGPLPGGDGPTSRGKEDDRGRRHRSSRSRSPGGKHRTPADKAGSGVGRRRSRSRSRSRDRHRDRGRDRRSPPRSRDVRRSPDRGHKSGGGGGGDRGRDRDTGRDRDRPRDRRDHRGGDKSKDKDTGRGDDRGRVRTSGRDADTGGGDKGKGKDKDKGAVTETVPAAPAPPAPGTDAPKPDSAAPPPPAAPPAAQAPDPPSRDTLPAADGGDRRRSSRGTAPEPGGGKTTATPAAGNGSARPAAGEKRDKPVDGEGDPSRKRSRQEPPAAGAVASDRSKQKDKDKVKSSAKDRGRERDKDRDKDREKKDKDKEKEKEKSKEKDKDRDRHHTRAKTDAPAAPASAPGPHVPLPARLQPPLEPPPEASPQFDAFGRRIALTAAARHTAAVAAAAAAAAQAAASPAYHGYRGEPYDDDNAPAPPARDLRLRLEGDTGAWKHGDEGDGRWDQGGQYDDRYEPGGHDPGSDYTADDARANASYAPARPQTRIVRLAPSGGGRGRSRRG